MQNPPPRASFGFSNQHRNAALLIGQHECDGCIFADLTLNDNYRQACSLISGRNILFVNCQFLNTGMTGGTAPQAGVDFEPNGPADYLVNVTLRNCSAKNNVGGGFFLSYSNLNNNSEPVSIVFDECSVDGQHGDFNYGLYAYALPGYPDNKTTAVNGSIHWRGGSIGGTLNSAIAMSSLANPEDVFERRFSSIVQCEVPPLLLSGNSYQVERQSTFLTNCISGCLGNVQVEFAAHPVHIPCASRHILFPCQLVTLNGAYCCRCGSLKLFPIQWSTKALAP